MAKHPRGNRELIRAINRSAILNTIKTDGPISRTEIARQTGLSAATVSGITANLIASELVFDKGKGDSRGGRRPILLALNPRGGYVIGIKLAEENITCVLTDLESSVVAKDTYSLNNHSIQDVLELIEKSVGELLEKSKIRKQQLLGVGIGLAGIVNGKLGVLRHSPIFGWRNVPMKTMLQSRLDVPVYVDNDVNTLTFNREVVWRWSGC